MPAARRLILIIFVLLLILLFLTVPGVSLAQAQPDPWAGPARELAKKIVAVTGPRRSVMLSVRNISLLSDSEVVAVRRALEAELRAAGLRLLAKANDAPELRITLSENLQGLLWVAEVPRDDGREVVIVALPQPAAVASAAAPQMFILQSKLIWEQDEPILDFALTDAAGGATPLMLVLEPARLVIYRMQSGEWSVLQSAAIPGAGPASRDIRGRLLLERTSFELFIPGVACVGAAQSSLELSCDATDDWNLQRSKDVSSDGQLVRARNFFADSENDLRDTSCQKTVYFFNLAGLKSQNENFWLSAALDGRMVLYSARETDRRELLASFAGWGSDIAAIETDCGTRWQVLATRAGDWTEPDAVQAFEIVNHESVAVSAPVNFHGPITALWTPTEGSSARAVVRNFKTGKYEAYTLTLSCGR